MVKCAEQSPRICEDGTIRWYEGDTFELEFNFNFVDDSGATVSVLDTDTIGICIRDCLTDEIIYETEAIGTNQLTVSIDEETAKKFKTGKYFYCVRRNSSFITTLMRKNIMVVE